MCYATSRDGVHWDRPNLGLVEFHGSKNNNILKEGGSSVVMRDPNAPPKTRYRMLEAICGRGKDDGISVLTSPDGLHWSRGVEGKVLPFCCDTANQLLWDSRIGRYVAYLRGFPGTALLSRTVMRCEMDDPLKPWPYTPNPQMKPDKAGDTYITTELPTVMSADDMDPTHSDIYNPSVFQYPYAQDVYLAFPSVFRWYPLYYELYLMKYGLPTPKEVPVSNTVQAPSEKAPEVPSVVPLGREKHRYYERYADGVLEPQLAVSRDGIHWTRFREPYVPLGILGQEEDSGMTFIYGGMIRRGDKLYQYHSGFRIRHMTAEKEQHLGGLTLLIQPLDRFVAAETGGEGGWLMTPLLLFNGNHLELNIDCGAMGEAWVELRDEDNMPVPSYTLSDCDPIDLNNIRHIVMWRGKTDVSSLSNTPIRILIKMRSSKLYAFQFTD
jgi:hypothetical protein